MTGDELPPELAALDQKLRDRDRPSSAALLRQRVLSAVQKKLRESARQPWEFAAAVAAAALLWINFSMSIANDSGWSLGSGIDGERLEATAACIHAQFPELIEHEVYRQALLAQATSSLIAAPPTPLFPDHLLRDKDIPPWATP